MNCTDVIFFQAELTPERLAIIAQGPVIPYGRLAHGIVSAQARFAATGLTEGQTVALQIAHPIDHFVVACALFRMKIASVSINAAPDLALDNIKFDAVLTNVINPAVSQKQPAARMLLIDTSWFQDPVTFSVVHRSTASRDTGDWLCRLSCRSDNGQSATVVKTTARSLEAQILDYNLSAPPDWERMITIVDPTSDRGFLLALSALYQGRMICFADVATARNLIVAYKHHFLVGDVQDFTPLLAQQKANYTALPALRGAYVHGTSFSQALIAQCLETISPNTILSFVHPQVGVIAYGAANRIKDVSGAVGYVAPWMEVEILDKTGKIGAVGTQGELRVRRLTEGTSATRSHALPPRDEWVYPRLLAKRLPNNLLVVGAE